MFHGRPVRSRLNQIQIDNNLLGNVHNETVKLERLRAFYNLNLARQSSIDESIVYSFVVPDAAVFCMWSQTICQSSTCVSMVVIHALEEKKGPQIFSH